MPSKRPPPLENPPSASSSDSSEDEEVEASQEEEEEEDEEETTPLKPSSNKLNSNSNSNPTPISKPHPPSSDEEDDDFVDESDSDPDLPPQKHTNSSTPLDIKPISSKPMAENPKPKKPTTTEVVSASSKRKLETDEKDFSKKDKKKKKVSDLVEEVDEAEKKSGDEQKKLFQRLWTDEDEIVILKGVINFKKKGMEPSSQVTAFFDFIKESLRPDVNKVQLHGKIRSLKRKYQNAVKKAKNPGEDPKFSKDHEAKVYQMSKKAWGGEVGKDQEGEGKSVAVDVGSPNGKKSKNKKIHEGVAASSPNPKVTSSNADVTSSSPKVTTLPTHPPLVAVKVEDGGNSSEYTHMNACLRSQSFSSLPIPPPAVVEVFLKRGWDVIGTTNAQRFDQRWRDVMIAETKTFLARMDLVKEQTQVMLEVLESSNH